MKKIMIALLVSGGFSQAFAAGPTQVDVRAAIGVSTCTGAGATCPVTQSINAPAFTCCGTVEDQNVTELGTISADTKKDLAVPGTAQEHTLFSFSPVKGDLAGKTIYFGLELQPQRRGTAMAGKNVLFAFRQVEGSTDWERVGIVTNDEPYSATLGFTFRANGDVVSNANPNIIFNVGQEKL